MRVLVRSPSNYMRQITVCGERPARIPWRCRTAKLEEAPFAPAKSAPVSPEQSVTLLHPEFVADVAWTRHGERGRERTLAERAVDLSDGMHPRPFSELPWVPKITYLLPYSITTYRTLGCCPGPAGPHFSPAALPLLL